MNRRRSTSLTRGVVTGSCLTARAPLGFSPLAVGSAEPFCGMCCLRRWTRGQIRGGVESRPSVVNLVPQAKHRVHSLIHAYVGGARSVLTPQLNSIWDTSSLANLEIDDPAWVAQIRQEIVRLEGGREPAAPGQRDMSVQPPQ
jgi:hypothetical protein